ncbi:MAG: hypothetical protein CMF51_02260 [Legionellales bacterium]|nr:hypothetical protein [Legionellales bacterium]
MSLPSFVEIPFYDPSQDSGTAKLLGLAPGGCVRVHFVIGRGRPRVLPISRLAEEDAAIVTEYARGGEFEKAAKPQAVLEVAEEESGSANASGSTCELETDEDKLEFPCVKSLSTWTRLLRFGDACASRRCFSEEGMKALWALFLPRKAEVWLDSLSSKVDYEGIIRMFARVWWKYCCACAHTSDKDVDKRTKIMLLELVCSELSKVKSKHGCVFSALLMQVGILQFHDQSLCYVGANLDCVGYNHKVDCGKVGPLVKASSLLRHERVSVTARRSLAKLRNPKAKVVWLLQKKSKNFQRMRRYMLRKFQKEGEAPTRMLPGTTTISYWSDEKEEYVEAKDFHTTLDAVTFKRCGDELIAGDVWLQHGREEWRVREIQQSHGGNADRVCVHVKRGSVLKLEDCATTRVVPTA